MDIQCPKCFSKNYTKLGSQDYKCKGCGHTYDVDDMKAAMTKDNGEKFRKSPGKQHENLLYRINLYLGEVVIDNVDAKCDKCGMIHWRGEMETVNGKDYCPHCIDSVVKK